MIDDTSKRRQNSKSLFTRITRWDTDQFYESSFNNPQIYRPHCKIVSGCKVCVEKIQSISIQRNIQLLFPCFTFRCMIDVFCDFKRPALSNFWHFLSFSLSTVPSVDVIVGNTQKTFNLVQFWINCLNPELRFSQKVTHRFPNVGASLCLETPQIKSKIVFVFIMALVDMFYLCLHSWMQWWIWKQSQI